MAEPAPSRYNLRSGTTRESAQPPEPDPEAVLRKGRKARNVEQTKGQLDIGISNHPDELFRRVEAALVEKRRNRNYGAFDEEFDESRVSILSSREVDPEESFNRYWGYLPPLKEEAAIVLNAIIENPSMAKDYARVGPENANFLIGLLRRNVFTTESPNADPYEDEIGLSLDADPYQEKEAERLAYEQLWTFDKEKCGSGSNEALFQRTLMMSLIARQHLIYEKDATRPRVLDFSVETTWNCPPMPSRAYYMGDKFLTRPRPDLAVCFSLPGLIPDHLLCQMPYATMRLACYESTIEGASRVFHFFTVEAKKATVPSDDEVGRRQSLNNASQALHNMFEFFRDAGPEHEEIFFAKVRFFSVVASTQGLTIRIHRATKTPANGTGFDYIMTGRPDYPLQFEHRLFATIEGNAYDRKTVFESLKRIFFGYGVNVLHTLLRNASEALLEKFKNHPEELEARSDMDFYRHGQTKFGPRRSVAYSQSADPRRRPPANANISIDMLQSGTVTPTQNSVWTSKQASGSQAKRPRATTEDSAPERSIRQKTQ